MFYDQFYEQMIIYSQYIETNQFYDNSLFKLQGSCAIFSQRSIILYHRSENFT